MLDGENHVPVLAPHDVAVVNGEAAELAWVEILVVLWMWVAADEVADVHCPHGVVAERQTDGQVAHVLCFGDEKPLHACSSLKFLLDVCTADALLQNEELHPLVDDVLVILADELLCRALVLLWQRIGSVLLAHMYLGQFAVHHDEVEDALLASVQHVDVYRLVFVGVEVKYEPEVFEYLWHNRYVLIVSGDKVACPVLRPFDRKDKHFLSIIAHFAR